MNSLELCAGAGGQAQGLERSGFEHEALVEIDAAACSTLRLNRPQWNIIEGDLSQFDARAYKGVDLVAGGVPCPPFSKAGKQMGANDERDLFPQAIRIVDETRPQAVMLENVRGLLDNVFSEYRKKIAQQLQAMGYWTDWHLFNAADFGVCQLRPRVVCVALRKDIAPFFRWPAPSLKLPPTVGELLHDLMKANDWQGADQWRDAANKTAPTLVGGSKNTVAPIWGQRAPGLRGRLWVLMAGDLPMRRQQKTLKECPDLLCVCVRGYRVSQMTGNSLEKRHQPIDKLAMHFHRWLRTL